jgi:hypothetical protein
MNPLIVLLVASAVQLTAVVLHPLGVSIFPLIVGILSVVFIVTVQLLKAKKPETLAKTLFVLPLAKVGLDNKPMSVSLLIASVLFILWAVGAGVFTFQGPFTVTSNVRTLLYVHARTPPKEHKPLATASDLLTAPHLLPVLHTHTRAGLLCLLGRACLLSDASQADLGFDQAREDGGR